MKPQLSKKRTFFYITIQRITFLLIIMITTGILFQSMAEAAEKSLPNGEEKITVEATEQYGKDSADNPVYAAGNQSPSGRKFKTINSTKIRLAATVYFYNGEPRQQF